MGKRRTQGEIIAALYKADGVLAVASRLLGITRQTIYNRMEKEESQKIAFAYKDASATTTELVIGELVKNCKAGKETSIFYYLNNKGESHGFGKPSKIALTDPTGTKEYAADARDAIIGKLLPELTDQGQERED